MRCSGKQYHMKKLTQSSKGYILIRTQMLAIRLKGIGKKYQRSFRVVLQETRSKLLGKFIEDLGWYNPHTNKLELNKERIQHWVGVGARPSMTVVQIMK